MSNGNESEIPETIYDNPIIQEPIWRCVPCQSNFANLYSLRRHMRLIHNAPRTLVRIDDDGVRHGEPAW